MQVKLYETTNVIEMLYLNHGYSLTGGTAGIGLSGSTTGGWTNTAKPPCSFTTYQSTSSTPSTDLRFTPASNTPPAQLALTPKAVDFGFTFPTSPITMCATANNVGSATLHILGFNVSGPADFAILSGPAIGDSILPGNSAQFCFTFTPKASGTRSAMFNLSTDGRDSGIQSITLTGNGLLPAVQYGVSDLFRKSYMRLGDSTTPRYVTVRSSGTADLTINSIYVIGDNPSSYTITHVPPSPLPRGVTDSIGILFNPQLEGRPDASLVIGTDAQNTPWDTVKMLGIGVLPRLVVTAPDPGNGTFAQFDSVALGDSVCQSVSLFNPGSDTLHVQQQIMTSADYDFSFYQLKGDDTLIYPGATKLVNICFHPIKNGNRQATIRFYTDIPPTFESPARDTSQVVLDITGVGVPFGTLAFSGPLVDTSMVGEERCVSDTITNTGQAELTVTSAALSGADASAFTSNVALPLSLMPGESRALDVCFKPIAKGAASAALTLTVISAERTSTHVIPIAGFGQELCASSDPATSVSFGSATGGKTILSSSDSTSVVVTNCGNVSETFTASVAAPYIVSPATSGPIAPGGTFAFNVNFTPTAMGAANGTLAITGGATPLSLSLAGVGGDVVLANTDPNPAVDTDDTKNIDVTVTNTGNMDWNGGTPSISGQHASDFSYVSGPNTVVAGGTGTLTLAFHPSTVGSESVTVTFPNATPTPSAGAPSFTVSGVGQAPASSGVAEVTQKNGYIFGATYPNPSSGSAEVVLTMPRASDVRIDILDIQGTFRKTAFADRLSVGEHPVLLDLTGLASGTYVCIFTSGEVRLTRALTIVK